MMNDYKYTFSTKLIYILVWLFYYSFNLICSPFILFIIQNISFSVLKFLVLLFFRWKRITFGFCIIRKLVPIVKVKTSIKTYSSYLIKVEECQKIFHLGFSAWFIVKVVVRFIILFFLGTNLSNFYTWNFGGIIWKVGSSKVWSSIWWFCFISIISVKLCILQILFDKYILFSSTL